MTKAGQLSATVQEPGSTGIRLKARQGMGSLNIELTLDPHVYLHEAELILDCGAHAKTVPHGFKDGSSIAWRQIEGAPDDPSALTFSIWWRAVANASPGAGYDALITVRDSRCILLEAQTSFENPARTRGQIGPVGNPTDIGRIGVFVEPG